MITAVLLCEQRLAGNDVKLECRAQYKILDYAPYVCNAIVRDNTTKSFLHSHLLHQNNQSKLYCQL